MALTPSSILRLISSLSNKDRGESEMREGLAIFYRRILSENRVSARRWVGRLERYIQVHREHRKIKDSPASFKGNMTKSIVNDRITFVVLCRAIALLAKDEFTITVTLQYDNESHSASLKSGVEPDIYPSLKQLHNDLLTEMGIDSVLWARLLDAYCKRDDFRKVHGKSSRPQAYKTALTKAVAKERMMFPNFVKAVSLLGANEIIMTVQYVDEKDKSHTTEYTLRPYQYLLM